MILLLNWVTICLGSYTLLLNSTKLYGDLFLNYTLVVLVGELPGTIALLFTLKFFGRRLNLFIVQFVLGNHLKLSNSYLSIHNRNKVSLLLYFCINFDDYISYVICRHISKSYRKLRWPNSKKQLHVYCNFVYVAVTTTYVKKIKNAFS